MKGIKCKLLIFLSIICYRFVLELIYTEFISPIYSYAGYSSDASNMQYAVSWIILIIVSFGFISALLGKDRFWKYVSYIILCLKFIPLTVLIAYVNYPAEYVLQTFIFWFTFIIGYNTLPSFRTIRYSWIRNNRRTLNILLKILICIFVISVLYVSIKYTGFRLHTSLFDVYDIRFEQREVSYPKVFSYLLAASSILCPLILSFFLDKKKYLYALLFCFIIYVDFSIAGLKSIIFTTIIAIILRIVYSPKILYYIPVIASIAIASIFLLNETFQIGTSFVLWRTFFVPSGMDYEYYTFFKIFEPDYYRNSVLRRLGFVSPYKDSSVDIAVGEYFNPEIDGIRANNGLISEAYANFGSYGCILFPILIIMYIKILSSFAKYTDERYLVLISIVFTYAIISTFIPATFMSSGVIYMIFFLITYSKLQYATPITKNY